MLACGRIHQNSHFDKTFHTPIIKKDYKNIRWAVNESSILKKLLIQLIGILRMELKFTLYYFLNA